jgi:hypothetical protein
MGALGDLPNRGFTIGQPKGSVRNLIESQKAFLTEGFIQQSADSDIRR